MLVVPQNMFFQDFGNMHAESCREHAKNRGVQLCPQTSMRHSSQPLQDRQPKTTFLPLSFLPPIIPWRWPPYPTIHRAHARSYGRAIMKLGVYEWAFLISCRAPHRVVPRLTLWFAYRSEGWMIILYSLSETRADIRPALLLEGDRTRYYSRNSIMTSIRGSS